MEGLWYDVCRGRLVSGGIEQTDYYTQTEIPYFLKAGSILVTNPPLKHLKAVPEELIIKVVPGGDGETRHYEDEGDTDGYKQGLFATTRMTQVRTDRKITFTIEPRTGAFPGMIEERSYQVVFLLEDKPEGITLNGEPTDNWTFDEMAKSITVHVPKTRCNTQVQIEIARNTSAVNGKKMDGTVELYYDTHADEMVASMSRKAKKLQLQIVSMDGREAARRTAANTDRLVYSLAQLPQGSYVCRLKIDGQSITRKFVK